MLAAEKPRLRGGAKMQKKMMNIAFQLGMKENPKAFGHFRRSGRFIERMTRT
jgi:hypothetical protein